MLIHWIWFSTRPDLSDREKASLLEYFRDPEDIFYANKESFREVEFLTQDGAAALADKNLRSAEEILSQCMEKGIHICTFHDAGYPSALKNISDPPLVLYYKGNLPDLDSFPVIAMVGTRKATGYGINVAKRIGGQIARCGGVVVSGMASGIDAAAIGGALTAGGMTVGVLGSGVDIVYPVCNRGLFADVERYGCLISEFPPGTPPLKWNFPKRNRIMSGLANGVLVIEAPAKSGALITARQAADQGRDVFVIPGNVDSPACEGSNALLREGAIAVAKGWDVMSEYLHLYPEKIRREDGVIRPAGFTDEVMAAAAVEEKSTSKVAQKMGLFKNKRSSDRKSAKITIDKKDKSTYSDIREQMAELSQEEKCIVTVLQDGEKLVDDVIALSGLPAGSVTSALTMMEINGIIEKKPGNRVSLK